jgi:hypothetical protein
MSREGIRQNPMTTPSALMTHRLDHRTPQETHKVGTRQTNHPVGDLLLDLPVVDRHRHHLLLILLLIRRRHHLHLPTPLQSPLRFQSPR